LEGISQLSKGLEALKADFSARGAVPILSAIDSARETRSECVARPSDKERVRLAKRAERMKWRRRELEAYWPSRR
jgi:hypothetical protein